MLMTFVWKQKRLVHLIHELTDFSKFNKPKNYANEVHQLNFYSKMYGYYCIIGVLTYIYWRYLEGLQCYENNEVKGLTEICGLIASIWMPFDVEYFPVKQSFYVSHFIICFSMITGGAAISFTTYEVAVGIVLKLQHLQQFLKTVFDNPVEEICQKQLFHCIEYHKHIIR